MLKVPKILSKNATKKFAGYERDYTTWRGKKDRRKWSGLRAGNGGSTTQKVVDAK